MDEILQISEAPRVENVLLSYEITDIHKRKRKLEPMSNPTGIRFVIENNRGAPYTAFPITVFLYENQNKCGPNPMSV